MTLPAPSLDDRHFQDLVDDAKRMVQQRCPDWTDHNVSDPGITLIETFAYLFDQVIYRLNRVPDRLYVKFLELIGERLRPAAAARTSVTFWLSAPQPRDVVVPVDTVVATARATADASVLFSTTREVRLTTTRFAHAAIQPAGDRARDMTAKLAFEGGFAAFNERPEADDALFVGLSTPVSSCAVSLRFRARIEGVGVDPGDPPIAWEAWTHDGWRPCEVGRDTTGAFNRDGEVVLHVPDGHVEHLVGGVLAAWLRARVLAPEPDRVGRYVTTPHIHSISAATIGGTVEAVNAQRVVDEVLGVSEGIPGQRFALRRSPVVADVEPVRVEVSGASGWHEWAPVEHFGASGPQDRHFLFDAVGAEVVFGPATREVDGTLRRYGAVLPQGAVIRVTSYRHGGGTRGNVAAGTLTVLRTTIPFVSRVVNRIPAVGGTDAESIEAAKIRGPAMIRTRGRAVTADDYEQLTLDAAPELARAHCLAVADGSADDGWIRVLVVPGVDDGPLGEVAIENLVPRADTIERVVSHLDERRCLGARITVEPPRYQGVTVVAQLRAFPHAHPEVVRRAALEALFGHLHPVRGGHRREGWTFGRAISVGELYSLLQHVPGCEEVDEALLFGADPITGERGDATSRLDLAGDTLVFSYAHQVRVEHG